MHKYGVKLPTSLDEAKRLDERNMNTLWIDTINKEMENLKLAFDILKD